MALSFRLARLDDLPRAHALLVAGGRDSYDAASLSSLLGIWRTWIAERRMEMHLCIDDSFGPSERVRGLAAGVMVSDAFADGLIANPLPYVARQVVAEELRGRSVVLTREQVAQANAMEGVNFLGLDFAMPGVDWLMPRALRWTPVFHDSLRFWVDGWKIRSGLREFFGRDLYLMARLAGWPLVQDHQRAKTQPPDAAWPLYLVGMARHQPARRWYSLPTAIVFNEPEPQFDFSPAEQDLLYLALCNVPDEQIAVELHVSPHTVKMRWRAILARATERQADLFPISKQAREGTRGAEKRRHLLAYLSRQMVELRPRTKQRS